MTSIVLQQVTSKFAKTNANGTLDKPIALKYIQKNLTPDQFQKLESKCTEKKVFVWGAKAERVVDHVKLV